MTVWLLSGETALFLLKEPQRHFLCLLLLAMCSVWCYFRWLENGPMWSRNVSDIGLQALFSNLCLVHKMYSVPCHRFYLLPLTTDNIYYKWFKQCHQLQHGYSFFTHLKRSMTKVQSTRNQVWTSWFSVARNCIIVVLELYHHCDQ